MNKRTLIACFLILLGICLMLMKGETLNAGELIGLFWPSLFAIPLSIFFHWLYFFMLAPKAPGVLIPGGILLTAGIVCQIGMLFGNWEYLWPGFILAPAVGLFEFYWFGGRNKWLLIPINILTIVSLLFFALFSLGSLFNQMVGGGKTVIAAVLIIVGALVLFSKKRSI
ncbi:hypothetical protein ACFSL6_03660 [Paenibacillus thailandensis]|uniref:DUF5668 domain-containing protein n=1 Tax=Paenibacillus thailandensis TaxID=393250 RepID=A0ABW5R401_9BACL